MGTEPVEPPESAWQFPDPARLPPDEDLVAVGADLSPGTLLAAYRRGLFPMPIGPLTGDRRGAEAGPAWFCPVQRGVLRLQDLRVSRSLRRSARRFTTTVDRAFDEVLAGCADPSRPYGWIDDDIASAYRSLHRWGWAHSVEVWQNDTLVGGLYGVQIGGLFAGESMFHRVRDASKVALVGLVERLRDPESPAVERDRLIDVQWRTDHLASLGVIELDRADYLARLPRALALPPRLS